MKKFAIALALGLSLASTPSYAAKNPNMTPMELQSIQSKEFETNKETAFGAVMTVVQDLGYTVQSADLNSGFITAASPTENKTGFFDAMVGAASSGNTVMTAFILHMPSGMTRVRLNFVNSKNMSSAYGRDSREDKPILDPHVYRTAWDKIDEALFVMGALSSSAPAPKAATPAADLAMPGKLSQPVLVALPQSPQVSTAQDVTSPAPQPAGQAASATPDAK